MKLLLFKPVTPSASAPTSKGGYRGDARCGRIPSEKNPQMFSSFFLTLFSNLFPLKKTKKNLLIFTIILIFEPIVSPSGPDSQGSDSALNNELLSDTRPIPVCLRHVIRADL